MPIVIPASPPLSEADLLANAEGIAGLTLGELAAKLDLAVPASLQAAKGWVGQLIEQSLGATATSLPEPDFQHIGVELKTWNDLIVEQHLAVITCVNPTELVITRFENG